ncbi:MAG: two-component system cell cycle sensor histidine kinase/response regulator CckA, partial [Candidatus Promineifilaceae bacterium]
MLNTPSGNSGYEQRGLPLFKKLLQATFVCLGVFIILAVVLEAESYLISSLAIAFVSIPIFLLLTRLGYIRLVSYLLCALIIGLTWHGIFTRVGTIKTPVVTLLTLVVPLTLFFFNRLESIAVITGVTLSIVVLYVMEQNEILGYGVQSNLTDLFVIILIIVLLSLSFYFILRWGMLQREIALENIGSQYKRLYDNIPIGLYRTTTDGRQLKANRAMWQLEGYLSEEESLADVFDIGREWYVDSNRRSEFANEIERNGRVVNFESQIYHRKTGEKIWVSESAFPVFDDQGTLLFYEGSVQDITHRKWTESKNLERAIQLKQLSDDYRSVTNTARDVILRTDSLGLITFANPATSKLFGYHPNELLGESVELLIDERDRGSFWRKITRRVKNPLNDLTSSGVQVRGVRKNGEKILTEITLSDWVDSKGNIIYTGIVRDVTDREKTAEFLNHMQRLDSLGLLAGGIAHDFNNLLVSILGQTSVALRKLPEDSLVLDNLLKVKTAGLRAAELCGQLLAYSGKGHFEIQSINLNELIVENINLHQIAIADTIELKTKFDNHLPLILGDRAQVQQVIMNLLINAADAIENEDGKISLSTEYRLIGGRDSLLWTRSGTPLKPGQYAVLHVTDNGRGMDKETLERIFEPFFTTKAKGNGLGLSAVQGIVRGHKGSMLVHSNSRGTTFSIYFPIEKANPSESIDSDSFIVLQKKSQSADNLSSTDT